MRSLLGPVAALGAATLAWWGIGSLGPVVDPAQTLVADAVAAVASASPTATPQAADAPVADGADVIGAVNAPTAVAAAAPGEPLVTVTPHRPAWNPTRAEREAALAEARALPLEEAAGRVIVASWSSTDEAALGALVSDLSLGGVILMEGHGDADAVARLTAAANAAMPRDWGAMIGVDEEGGIVSRLGGVIPTLPGFMAAGAAASADVTAAYEHQAAGLAEPGVHDGLRPRRGRHHRSDRPHDSFPIRR
ncbi:glycoside hydrolase family 3 N-terminal domain-containing protein [Demequina litorisediminis]|uniref:Glycoside hydrolase family 3 N-terminal domain-containing protein n=1 Tax=Demequina litorisediminis TaxID=1849022 RepID=A0ABQ6IHQ3_9MICO|nr:glycoside hydrolase family 3 N-terminal domain-containing protein [Demequina litorisediminis]GMA36277.1 hypothetical protein GCM10025876_24810 [Demequina litorisediminis]